MGNAQSSEEKKQNEIQSPETSEAKPNIDTTKDDSSPKEDRSSTATDSSGSPIRFATAATSFEWKPSRALSVETGKFEKYYTVEDAQLIASLEDKPLPLTPLIPVTPRPSIKVRPATPVSNEDTKSPLSDAGTKLSITNGVTKPQIPSPLTTQTEAEPKPSILRLSNFQVEPGLDSGFTTGFSTRRNTTELNTDSELLQLRTKHIKKHKWRIIVACFIIHLAMTGFIQSFGVWFVAYIDFFGDAKWKTAMVGSVTSGMNLFVGPIASALCTRFGHRKVCISGSIVVTSSLLLSTLAPSIDVLIITCGVMAGTGLGLMYLPSIVIIGDYFEKRRALATGLAMCGSGIGSFVFAPLSRHLIDTYGWQDGMKVIAFILLAGVPMGALLVPANKTLRTTKKEPKLKRYLHRLGLRRKRKSGNPQQESQSMDDKLKELPKEPVETRPSRQSLNLNVRPSILETDSMFDCQDLLEDVPTREQLDKVILTAMHDISSLYVADGVLSEVYSIHEKASQMLEEVMQSRQGSVYGGTSIPVLPILVEAMETGPEDDHTNQPSTSKNEPISPSNIIVRDEQSGGTVTNGFTKNGESISKKNVETRRTRMDRVRNVCRTINKTIGFSVLKNPKFALYGVSSFTYTLGIFVPLYYITSRAEQLNIDGTESSLLLSIIGISNTISRVIIGWIADKKWVGVITLNVGALMIAGTITALLPLYNSYALLAGYSAVFGCAMATFVSLRSIIVIELMGLQKLTKAFGILGMLQGLASFAGPPIAGCFFDLTGNYTVTFVTAGCSLVLAGFMALPLVFINKQSSKQEQEKKLREKLEIISKMSRDTVI